MFENLTNPKNATVHEIDENELRYWARRLSGVRLLLGYDVLWLFNRVGFPSNLTPDDTTRVRRQFSKHLDRIQPTFSWFSKYFSLALDCNSAIMGTLQTSVFVIRMEDIINAVEASLLDLWPGQISSDVSLVESNQMHPPSAKLLRYDLVLRLFRYGNRPYDIRIKFDPGYELRIEACPMFHSPYIDQCKPRNHSDRSSLVMKIDSSTPDWLKGSKSFRNWLYGSKSWKKLPSYVKSINAASGPHRLSAFIQLIKEFENHWQFSHKAKRIYQLECLKCKI